MPTRGRQAPSRRGVLEIAPAEGTPTAPRGLDAAGKRLWRQLWAEPVSVFWRPADAALVARLIMLRGRLELEGADAPVSLYGATLALEKDLLLTPRSRASRVSVRAPELAPADASPAPRGQVARLSARERDRMLRA